MASSKVWLCALLGLCLVTMVLSAAVEYNEPEMEANTSSGDEAKEVEEEEEGSGVEGGSGADAREDKEMSEDMEDMNGSGEEGSSGDGEKAAEEEKGSGEMDAEKEASSGDMEMVDTMRKINDVEEEEEKSEEKEESSSSEEEGKGSSSSEEEPGMLTKCSGGIEGISAMINGTNATNCEVSKAMQLMVEALQKLSSEVSELKGQVAKSCSGGGGSKEDSDESDEEEEEESEKKADENMASKSSMEAEGSGSGDGQKAEEEEEEESNKKKKCDDDEDEESTTEAVTETTTAAPTTPPPPAACPPPFQLLAQSCYYIQTDQREWRSWGDAHSFCQQQGGTLAAPYRVQDLRDYLTPSYSNSFWVGARLLDGEWLWVTGRPLQAEDWRTNRPHKHPSQRCVYLDSFYGYKGSNYFCGEKFSFICEHRGV